MVIESSAENTIILTFLYIKTGCSVGARNGWAGVERAGSFHDRWLEGL